VPQLDSLQGTVPDHVPDELVWDHGFAQFLYELEDPYLAAARLHEGPGVIWAKDASYGNPAWILTRHEHIKEAYADFEHFSSTRGRIIAAVMEQDWMMLPVEADPPAHHHYRNVLTPFFTPAAISKRTAEISNFCEVLIDNFIDRGSCEFISEFAAIFPNSMVLALLVMPQEMLPQFLKWEETAIHGADDAERFGALSAIIDYLKRFIAEQRANPRTELMEGILFGRFDDRPLNDAEILGICYLLYVAGLDTVLSSFGWIMRYLASDQALQQRLRSNPQQIPAAVEEFARAYGVSAPTRTVAKDFNFHGVPMRKGDDVLLPTFLAGRDPRSFNSPHTIDIDRRPRHVTFGTGPHVCLGIHLAKREMATMIESFLSRMNNIHIPAGETFTYHTEGTIGIDRLPLAWDLKGNPS